MGVGEAAWMELLFGGEHCLAFATDGSHTQDTCRAGGDLQPILIVLLSWRGVCLWSLHWQHQSWGPWDRHLADTRIDCCWEGHIHYVLYCWGSEDDTEWLASVWLMVNLGVSWINLQSPLMCLACRCSRQWEYQQTNRPCWPPPHDRMSHWLVTCHDGVLLICSLWPMKDIQYILWNKYT